MNRIRIAMAALAIAAGLLTACGDDDGGGGDEVTTTAPGTSSSVSPTTEQPAEVTLTLLTYDSFVAPEALARFTEQTGIAVQVATGGDAGTLVNKAILTAGNPEGDVLWGVDNTLLSRALDTEGLFLPFAAKDLALLDPAVTVLVPGHEVTPVDTGDVCLNYDKGWFTEHGIEPPDSLDDLREPAYKDLLVVEDPATSTPGLAFLLATVAYYGDPGFAGYWEDLRSNGVLVVDSWDTAYYSTFTAGSDDGTRPIVVSYASSPPATIVFAPDPKPEEPTTANVDASCFRQVEFAGILDGTAHEAEAQQLIDFLIGEDFQSELPLSNFVYPVRQGVALPDVFEQFATQVAEPLTVPPADIAINRDAWVEAWDEAVNS